MSRRSKTFLWIIGSLICLMSLIVGFLLLLPYLINLGPIKEKILAALSEQQGGKVEYQRLDLSYFPQPRVKVHRVRISIPEKAEGTLKSIQAYPEILAILRGKVRLSRVELEAPDLSIQLPKAREKTTEKPKLSLLQEISGAIAQVSAVVSKNFPNLNVVMIDGSVNVQEESQLVLSLRDLDGRILFSHAMVKVEVSCRSNLWEKISVQAAVNSIDFKGQGQIKIVNFYPHVLTDSLVHIAPWRIEESGMYLQVRFEIEGPKTLRVEVDATIPLIALHQGSKAVVIRGMDVKGYAQVDGERMEVSLSELTLDHPHLKLSAKFQKENQPAYVALNVEGRDVGVGLMREAAFSMAEEVPILQETFDYVRGGQIPLITLSSQGHSIQDLGKMGNLIIKGRIEGGKVFIRPAKLNFEKVAGDMVISRGILQGENLEASIGNSKAREGTLKLGLEGGEAPFHLEVMLDADLTQVQSILNGLVKDKGFIKESSMIDNLKGRAKGRLILGESLESMNTRIDVSELSLSAKYRRIPYPLEITTGQFHYEADRIGLKNLAGKVGRSSFSELTGQLSADKKAYLEILSGKIAISLEDIHPWLSSQKLLGDALKDIKSLRGTVNFTGVNLKGPLSRPKNWYFQAAGDMRNLAVETNFVPGPITVSNGKFRVDPKTISLSDVHTNLLNASINFSGTFDAYLNELEKVELDLDGKVTPKDIQWLSESLKMIKDTHINSSIDISGAHFLWRKGEYTSFRGNLTFEKGPQIYLDLIQKPDQLKVDRLAVRDETSNCVMMFDLQDRAVKIGFSGELSEKTLDNIFSGYQFQNGWLKGDFGVTLLMGRLMQSTVQGRLEADDLSLPWQLEKQLEVNHISLTGYGNHISIAEARFAWGEMPFVLSGDVSFSEKSIRLDVDLSTERFDLDQVTKSLPKGENGKGAQDLSNLQVEGTIRFKSNSLKYGRFTWEPVQGVITVGQNVMEVNVEEAKLCGISMPGVVKVIDKELSLDIRPVFRNHELEPTIKCLLDQELRAIGNFDFHGRIFAQGKLENLMNSLRGDVELQAKDGRIYSWIGLLRILEFLNATEIYKGELPNLKKEGLAYKLVTMKASFQNGKLIIKEATLDGPTLEMAGQGEIDLFEGKLNLTVLVAPLKTVDRIIKLIPFVNYILVGTLITVPVRIRGDLKDPKVNPLSPSAAGSELLEIMRRTLGLPFRVIDLLRPQNKEESRGER